VLHLRSHDDGQPSPVALRERPAGRREGTGLLAMRERFADYGGTIEASTTSADGFTIHGFLPMLSGAS
jgi:signal transduction histidine kinase